MGEGPCDLAVPLALGAAPGDASELVGQGDGGAVVSVSALEREGPGLEAVGSLD